MKKCFEVTENIQAFTFEGDWAKLLPKICLLKLSENFSVTIYTSNDDSTISKKYPFWLENVSSFKKQLIDKVESFLKLNFDLNQRYKIVLTQNHQIWNFNATDLPYIFMMIGEMLRSYRKYPKIQV